MDNIITSRNNPLIRDIARLSEKKFRESSGMFIFEGFKLAEEAHNAGIVPEYMFVTESAYEMKQGLVNSLGGRLVKVTPEVYDRISEEKSPQGLLCAAKHLDNLHKKATIYSIAGNTTFEGSPVRFLLSSIRDPGNLGTMIRTAAAFGVDELLISSDCAELYNPKTLRASMGAIFIQRVTICEDIAQAVKALRESGYNIYAATLNDSAVSLMDARTGRDTCFVIGNEGHGLSEEGIRACTGSVTIPMEAGSESLNAAAAAAILMWESYRNR